MSQTINTSLTVKNETDIRGEAMLSLIRQYITFADGFYGFKSIGAVPDEIQFPVLFVEPKSQSAVMDTTAKFTIKIMYALYWYVRDNKLQDCLAVSTFIGEALVKLFSNNALGDIGSVPPSNKFKQYPNPGGGYYWLEAVIKSIDWSVAYLDPQVAPNLRYERSGRMMIEIMDVILK